MFLCISEIFVVKLESCLKLHRNLDVFALPNFAPIPKKTKFVPHYYSNVEERHVAKFRVATPTIAKLYPRIY